MINQCSPNQPALTLESDLAGEYPLYLYWPHDQSILLYSKSITELLNDSRVPKPLKVSNEGLSFLLQSGVVPPPKTAYQDIYILGIGDKAKVSTVNGKIDIQFSHVFPFLNANRLAADEMQADEDLILQLLAEATISRIDQSKPSFLFHSAGKDSNSIALALAEAGWQDKVTLITHKSKGQADESEISARIAKHLGFKHLILHEVDQLKAEHKQAIEEYFVNIPFPCIDSVALAYPLYAQQLPELKNANLIDGGGNDSYMMTPPDNRQKKIITLSKFTHRASILRRFVSSESLISSLIRTPAEWCGMSGLSFADIKMLFAGAVDVYPHWKKESDLRKNWDLFDFKTSILTPVVASEVHIRKARNFAEYVNSNFILPFANQKVAEYFAKMPEAYLYNRKSLKNKIILRKILKKRIGLDSDLIGKMGYTHDFMSLLEIELDSVVKEINSCGFWKKNYMVVERFKDVILNNKKRKKHTFRYLHFLYVISSHLRLNKYVK
jgi:asparagine synthase (glutamine-hydrolysing)